MASILKKAFFAATFLMSATTGPATAEDRNFYIKLGPATLLPAEGAKVKAGGSIIPGGTVSIANHTTAGFEIGYSFTPNWSLGFTGGFPPTVDVQGAGTLAGLGKLGAITYGPTALTVQYTFTDFGRIKPYFGAGPLYMFVFNNKDGAVSDLKVKPALGAAIQAGIDFDVTDRWGFFADVKKTYLRTTATGNLGATPISADVTLDPWVLGAGIKLRF